MRGPASRASRDRLLESKSKNTLPRECPENQPMRKHTSIAHILPPRPPSRRSPSASASAIKPHTGAPSTRPAEISPAARQKAAPPSLRLPQTNRPASAPSYGTSDIGPLRPRRPAAGTPSPQTPAQSPADSALRRACPSSGRKRRSAASSPSIHPPSARTAPVSIVSVLIRVPYLRSVSMSFSVSLPPTEISASGARRETSLRTPMVG